VAPAPACGALKQAREGEIEVARVVRLHAFGGPEHLRIEDVSSPQPGRGEVRLSVRAARVTRDHYTFMKGRQFKGHGFEQPRLPSRLGYEAAGVVDAVGPEVDAAWIGRRVAPLPGFDESRHGVLGDVAILPAHTLCEYPERLTPEQAASIWVPYLTAYGPLVPIARVAQGDFVVVLAASSAVGLSAIQIARDAGAAVVAVSRTPAKKDDLVSSGASHVIALEEDDYVGRIDEITGGRGARVTLDPIGGPLVERLAMAAAPGGIVVEYGVMSGQPAPLPIAPLIGKGLSIRGYTLNDVLGQPETALAARKYILERLADGRFTPRVARTFPLERIVDAYQFVLTNQQMGTVVLDCSR